MVHFVLGIVQPGRSRPFSAALSTAFAASETDERGVSLDMSQIQLHADPRSAARSISNKIWCLLFQSRRCRAVSSANGMPMMHSERCRVDRETGESCASPLE